MAYQYHQKSIGLFARYATSQCRVKVATPQICLLISVNDTLEVIIGLQGNKNRNEASRSQGVKPTLETVVERSTYYDPKGAQAQELNHAVAYFLAKDMQPLYTVEKPGFQKMIAKLNPRYKLPSRKHFSQQEIPRLYNQVKETVVNPKLSQIDFFFLVQQTCGQVKQRTPT